MKRNRSAVRDAEDRELVAEVLAAIRHDIRNKLASVRQASHYLKTRAQSTELWATDPRMARFFALIDSELEVADGLFLSHEALDKIHLPAPSGLDPKNIVAQAIHNSIASEWVDTTEVAPGRPYADEAELVVALTALIDNAIEANALEANAHEANGADASERTHVRVAGKVVDASYVFSVTDSGTDMNEATFVRQLRAFATTQKDRRGLGLSMVRHIALRYGGNVQLAKGTPTTSTELRIPLEVISLKESPLDANKRVLLIDDDDSARVTFAALLEDEGFEIVTASSGAELSELFPKEAAFGVAFVDYHLDGALGTELVPAIRSHSPKVVVVLVTGDNPGDLPVGVDGWIVKGGDPDALITAARKYANESLNANGS